jgi:predicted kinase
VNRKILIIGLPAAGKTTLANILAPLLNAVVFNADAVRANCRAISASATKPARAPHGMDMRSRG